MLRRTRPNCRWTPGRAPQPGGADRSAGPRYCACAPSKPRRATPTAEGSGKDTGELGGDSLAEVIGWWTTRVRSRLRAGRGTRRGGSRSSRVQRCGGAVSLENCGRGRGSPGLPGTPAACAVGSERPGLTQERSGGVSARPCSGWRPQPRVGGLRWRQ